MASLQVSVARLYFEEITNMSTCKSRFLLIQFCPNTCISASVTPTTEHEPLLGRPGDVAQDEREGLAHNLVSGMFTVSFFVKYWVLTHNYEGTAPLAQVGGLLVCIHFQQLWWQESTNSYLCSLLDLFGELCSPINFWSFPCTHF